MSCYYIYAPSAARECSMRPWQHASLAAYVCAAYVCIRANICKRLHASFLANVCKRLHASFLCKRLQSSACVLPSADFFQGGLQACESDVC